VPPNKNPYPRPKLNQSERDEYVAHLIDQLRDLERKTDPKDGARSAGGKDLAAAHALRIVGDLINALAGWALDHQAGLALKDLKSVPLKTAIPEDSNARLTRDALAKALTAKGYPVKPATLATKATRGGGPPYQLFGARPLYKWSTALSWAESRLSEPRSNSSEHSRGQR
jgi:hypothetical protein